MQNTHHRRGVFTPIFLNNIGLADHTIKHLQHMNQIPPSAPRQGSTYLDVKKYLG